MGSIWKSFEVHARKSLISVNGLCFCVSGESSEEKWRAGEKVSIFFEKT